MEIIITQIQNLASKSDEAGRKKIIEQLRDLSFSLEERADVVQRISHRHLEIAMVRVGIDLKIFALIAEKEGEVGFDELVERTGAGRVLLARILRYLSSMGLIAEPGAGRFAATNVTKALTVRGAQAGIYHNFNNCGPVYQALPDFLAKHKYQDITDVTNTPFQDAFNTPDPVFVYFSKHPEKLAPFNEFMAARRKGMPTWLSVFPSEFVENVKSSKEDVLFVDMGGNIGHQCADFKARFPEVEGRVVLQDLEYAIAMALLTHGVENTVHDIFTPQTVKGAKFYYLRAVLHDWPDAKCQEILRNIISAMGTDSAILLDEMVLPETKVHWEAAQIDMTMMACVAARERTRSEWEKLLGSVGLVVEEVWTYTPSVYESVMLVKRK
ncbi:S-adenosyl-L-methionine-dependent methyltransferase [Stipitochalara longipes BDJ]|nr:S-adenosyl-L-methionine-dependent methyltransferase [Stipitochalara longipes BDJ]